MENSKQNLPSRNEKPLDLSFKFFRDHFSTFWTLQLVGWFLYGVGVYITFLPVANEGNFVLLLGVKFFRALVGFGLSSAIHLIYSHISVKQGVRTLILRTLGVSITFGVLWAIIENSCFWIFSYYAIFSLEFNFSMVMATFPLVTFNYARALIAWSALYFGIRYWKAWQVEHERTLQANALAHKAQLEMLRYQLNPHFLFNALNSIRASIDEDRQRAKQMITEFSEFLRYSMNSNGGNIRLKEEIDAIRNYLAIEKIRYEDKLQVDFNIEVAAENYEIPGFLIHPLVENAIKHGTMDRVSPLKIQVIAQTCNNSLYLEVANTGQWQKKSLTNGVGLNNVRQRLAHHFPANSHLTISEQDGWVRASIEIGQLKKYKGE